MGCKGTDRKQGKSTYRIGWVQSQNEEIKAKQSEIKQNIQRNNREENETGTQINNLEQKEEISIQPEQNEEIRM